MELGLRIWWAVAAVLVLLMQVGFIFLEMGSVRRLNRPGIAVKNFVVLLVSTACFSLVGFRLMFGESTYWYWFGSLANLADLKLATNSSEWVFLQLGFATVAATIVTGSLAGRSTLTSNVVLSAMVTLVAYPLFGHWAWNPEGWLSKAEFVDYAGSGVVHLLGGSTALFAALVLGPREAVKQEGGGLRTAVGPRSLPHISIGVVFLWIGWIGFNGGSVPFFGEYAGRVSLIGTAIMDTTVAASLGGLAAMCTAAVHRRFRGPGRGMPLVRFLEEGLAFDPYATLSGCMGGMVAITANCGWVEGNAAVAAWIGVVGGCATFFVSLLVHRYVDDPVDAVAVHGGAGIVGLLMANFSEKTHFVVQLQGIAACIGIAAVTTVPVCWALRWLQVFRVPPLVEEIGLTWDSVEIPEPIKSAKRRKS